MGKIRSSNLVWLDLEMTGLEPKYDRILEAAVVVTDKYLNVLAEGPVLAIHQPPAQLKKMDEWNVRQHNKSGLVERVKQSRITEKLAEEQMLDFLAQHVLPKKSPLCGNTIYQDRRFLCRYMPKLEQFFHYRNFDVSTLKILTRYWFPKIAKGFKKETQHQALADVYDSINELKYYRKNILVKKDEIVIEES